MITIEHNADQVALRIHGMAAAVNAAIQGELRTLAERIASSMRLASPKFRSQLANSVRSEGGGFEWLIKPHAEYAPWVEKGRQPGKGLPRFDRSSPIVAWLEAHPHGGGIFRRPRKGTQAAVRHEIELRDRYMALSRYVRHHGIKARPFVAETAAEYREIVPQALAAAVQRALQGGAA